MTSEWWEPWCRTGNEGNIRQGKALDSRLQTSGMTEPPSCHSRGPLLSFPRFLAGIQSEQFFSRIQSGVIFLWQGEHDLQVVEAMASDGQ